MGEILGCFRGLPQVLYAPVCMLYQLLMKLAVSEIGSGDLVGRARSVPGGLDCGRFKNR